MKPDKREKNPKAINSTSDDQKAVSEPEKGVNGNAATTTPKKKPTPVADCPPTLDDIQAYMDERAQQGKPFIYVTAEGFLDACEQSGWRLKDGKPMMDWRARMRTFENYRKDHGDRPVAQPPTAPPKPGDPVSATRPTKNKYKNKW